MIKACNRSRDGVFLRTAWPKSLAKGETAATAGIIHAVSIVPIHKANDVLRYGHSCPTEGQ